MHVRMRVRTYMYININKHLCIRTSDTHIGLSRSSSGISPWTPSFHFVHGWYYLFVYKLLCYWSPFCWWRSGLCSWSSVNSTHLAHRIEALFHDLRVWMSSNRLSLTLRKLNLFGLAHPNNFWKLTFRFSLKIFPICFLYLCAWPRCHLGQLSHFFCSCPYTSL